MVMECYVMERLVGREMWSVPTHLSYLLCKIWKTKPHTVRFRFPIFSSLLALGNILLTSLGVPGGQGWWGVEARWSWGWWWGVAAKLTVRCSSDVPGCRHHCPHWVSQTITFFKVFFKYHAMALIWNLGLFSPINTASDMPGAFKILALLVTKQELRSPEHLNPIVDRADVEC